MFSKFFADKKHGGKNKARLSAREYNDELTRKLPPVSRRRGMAISGSSMKTKATAARRAKSGAFNFGRTTQLPRQRRRFAVSK